MRLLQVKLTNTSQTLFRQLARFFGLAYAISWLLWSPYYLPLGIPADQLPYFHLLGCMGPMLAALVLLYRENGLAGIRQLGGRYRFGWQSVRWLAIGFGAPIALLLVIIGMTAPPVQQLFNWQGLFAGQEFGFLSPLSYIAVNIFFFGFGEEVGWRGFALPRLQTRYSAFTANLILTGCWAIWHWPLFFNPLGGYMHMGAGEVIGWLFSLVTGGMLFTWLFNSSRGSVVACALFHSMMDVVFMADLNIPQLSTYTGALITLWGLYIWLVYRPATLSPSPKVTVDVPESAGTAAEHAVYSINALSGSRL
ncbi:hypothetical protein GCM10023189_37390 [Nibrella saemangeumensis]|uniref:CAAX prenyl protease 2/Lysostaphin resistance protein A-like domain-containing protein n=1 Tax=Nibrella saemangeumensis TaxID=1084526 RepID=A0ABP8N9T1_9BACT